MSLAAEQRNIDNIKPFKYKGQTCCVLYKEKYITCTSEGFVLCNSVAYIEEVHKVPSPSIWQQLCAV
jgi:hypothetical protein